MVRPGRPDSGSGEGRAVSPVVGTVLLVAIVLLLAVALGTLTAGFGDDPATRQPNIEFTFEFTDSDDGSEDVLDIVHDGGETVDVADGNQPLTVAAGDLFIVADYPYEDDTLGGGGSGFECGSPSGGQYECSFNFDDEFSIPGDSMSAGERFRLYGEEPDTPLERATVRIVYRPEGGTRSYILATWTGPEAEG
jgi:flagellin-like protein